MLNEIPHPAVGGFGMTGLVFYNNGEMKRRAITVNTKD
jgi:hypothetical protein